MWPANVSAVNMTGKTNVWPVKAPIRPDIVRWPAVILSPVIGWLLSQTICDHLFELHELQSTVEPRYNDVPRDW